MGHGGKGAETGGRLRSSEGSSSEATGSDGLRGERGKAGELHGSYDASSSIGTVDANTPQGIFGTSNGGFDGDALPVADPDEIEEGPATILANVSGSEVREYAVEISRADSGVDRLLVTVTDPELRAATGAIVQGM